VDYLLHRVKVLADGLFLELDAFLGQKFCLAMAGRAAQLSVYNGIAFSHLYLLSRLPHQADRWHKNVRELDGSFLAFAYKTTQRADFLPPSPLALPDWF
jgi:hypothetical protein